MDFEIHWEVIELQGDAMVMELDVLEIDIDTEQIDNNEVKF